MRHLAPEPADPPPPVVTPAAADRIGAACPRCGERDRVGYSGRPIGVNVEHYWLCRRCCKVWSVAVRIR